MFKKVLRGGIELGPEAKTVSDQHVAVIMLIQKWAFFRKQIKTAGFLANDDYISIIDTQENVHLPMEVTKNQKNQKKIRDFKYLLGFTLTITGASKVAYYSNKSNKLQLLEVKKLQKSY